MCVCVYIYTLNYFVWIMFRVKSPGYDIVIIQICVWIDYSYDMVKSVYVTGFWKTYHLHTRNKQNIYKYFTKLEMRLWLNNLIYLLGIH